LDSASTLANALYPTYDRTMVARTRRFLGKLSSLTRIGHTHVDLPKIDAEGAEWELFATTELRRHADLVMGELHDRHQHAASDLLPGLAGLRLEFTDSPHDTCFVAERLTSATGYSATAGL
jgi:hypothetical protein